MKKTNLNSYFYFLIEGEKYVCGSIVRIDKDDITVVFYDNIFESLETIDYSLLNRPNIFACLNTFDLFFDLQRWHVLNKKINENYDDLVPNTLSGISPASAVGVVKSYFNLIQREEYYSKHFIK
ncbi:hypothetical protein LY01_02789 [Nonlabens xylanidelens]|uniref:Uncharacterized protein n=1 Tax=Nonlabens xylanidelens TaxID=191564 RepID=A0A2S6IFU1_9FLAO|nr:hypothetical protein [Nonlabens xylanidelens]PPK93084.1 hypothetical protein LY01_02789 [Nonlabens xylanidelens]PQJ19633.1 hypothetical protein BST94_06535 [Nonlabens xylanidelens]PQJ22012.1 hypothetical protein BST94_03845 [Nonlabens xylanidelens]